MGSNPTLSARSSRSEGLAERRGILAASLAPSGLRSKATNPTLWTVGEDRLFSSEYRELTREAPTVTAQTAGRSKNAMARNEVSERVAPDGIAHGARGRRSLREIGNLPIRQDAPEGDREQRLPDLEL